MPLIDRAITLNMLPGNSSEKALGGHAFILESAWQHDFYSTAEVKEIEFCGYFFI